MNWRIVAGLFLVLAAGAGTIFWDQWQTSPNRVSGFVEADEIRVGSRIGGRVQQVLVQEGDRVKTGLVLVVLEPFDLHERLAEAELQFAAFQAQHEKLKAGYRAEEIAAAQAHFEEAQAAWHEATAGPREEEKREAQESLDQAQAELELAQLNLARGQKLFETKSASKEEYDTVASAHRSAQAAVGVQRARLELLRAGTRPERIAQAKARLDQAQAEHRLRSSGFRPQEIAEAQARMQAAGAAVAAIRQQLAELEIRAPCDAVVEAVDLQPGDLISPNAPVISLMDLRRRWIRAYVPSHWDIALDRPVTVAIDSVPGQRFAGRITTINRQAEFTPSNVQTPEERTKQVFRIKVELGEGTDVFRPGLAADVYLDAEPG